MTDDRLKEIKDSIDFQEKVMKAYGQDMLLVTEEKELYDEVIRLREETQKLKDDVARLESELQEETYLADDDPDDDEPLWDE